MLKAKVLTDLLSEALNPTPNPALLFQVHTNGDVDQSFSLPDFKKIAVLLKINLKLKFLVQISLDFDS